MSCSLIIVVLVAIAGLFLLAVFWSDLFPSPEKRLERDIENRKIQASRRSIAERAEDVIRYLGKAGAYEEGDLRVWEANPRYRYEPRVSSYRVTIHWKGAVVFEGCEWFYEADEKRPDGYDFGRKVTEAYIPGPWEESFDRVAARAAKAKSEQAFRSKHEREEEERKKFGL